MNEEPKKEAAVKEEKGPTKIKDFIMPLAIIIAGALIAGAVFVSNTGKGTVGAGTQPDQVDPVVASKNMRPVDATDHLRGDAKAAVTIVVYTDFQCPFCERFHPTVAKLLQDYAGKVRVVYRNFPLTQIHPNAQPAAEAAECIAGLAGNDAYWKAVDAFFNNQDQLGMPLYVKTAVANGVTEKAFTDCFNAKTYDARITADEQNAIDSGGRGTPYSIVVDATGNKTPFSGAIPYEQVKSIIDQALAK